MKLAILNMFSPAIKDDMLGHPPPPKVNNLLYAVLHVPKRPIIQSKRQKVQYEYFIQLWK
jgi:hypothetical protein